MVNGIIAGAVMVEEVTGRASSFTKHTQRKSKRLLRADAEKAAAQAKVLQKIICSFILIEGCSGDCRSGRFGRLDCQACQTQAVDC